MPTITFDRRLMAHNGGLSAGVFSMIRLCIKLLSTGSAMMWEGLRETTGEERGRERGCKWQFSVTPWEGEREGVKK